ncbi:MAG: type I-G CRISPR-associated RAMP protein Csb1/Cas7g [Bacilli bacterium]
MDVEQLDITALRAAVADAVAVRAVSSLEVIGEKVAPPTYLARDTGGKYAVEERRVRDATTGKIETVTTVLLDSIQSQSNRMEQALKRAHENGKLPLPVMAVDFAPDFKEIGRITTLDAPHRIADAIFRDSLQDGVPFPDTEDGKAFARTRTADATALLKLCPTALVYGVWDSTGKRGGLGTKFQRIVTSEIVGYDFAPGVKPGSRIDPLPIRSGIKIYETPDGGWTLSVNEARMEKDKPVEKGGKGGGKKGGPSAINLGNVPPSVEPGGGTVSRAEITSVLSLVALRKLSFPVPSSTHAQEQLDHSARTMLAALGLAGIALQYAEGFDLRSGCLLAPKQPLQLEIVHGAGQPPHLYRLDKSAVFSLYHDALADLRAKAMPWREELMVLQPMPKLLELIRQSIALGLETDSE